MQKLRENIIRNYIYKVCYETGDSGECRCAKNGSMVFDYRNFKIGFKLQMGKRKVGLGSGTACVDTNSPVCVFLDLRNLTIADILSTQAAVDYIEFVIKLLGPTQKYELMLKIPGTKSVFLELEKKLRENDFIMAYANMSLRHEVLGLKWRVGSDFSSYTDKLPAPNTGTAIPLDQCTHYISTNVARDVLDLTPCEFLRSINVNALWERELPTTIILEKTIDHLDEVRFKGRLENITSMLASLSGIAITVLHVKIHAHAGINDDMIDEFVTSMAGICVSRVYVYSAKYSHYIRHHSEECENVYKKITFGCMKLYSRANHAGLPLSTLSLWNKSSWLYSDDELLSYTSYIANLNVETFLGPTSYFRDVQGWSLPSSIINDDDGLPLKVILYGAVVCDKKNSIKKKVQLLDIAAPITQCIHVKTWALTK